MTDLFILSHFFQYASSFVKYQGDAGRDRAAEREKKSYRQIGAHFVYAA